MQRRLQQLPYALCYLIAIVFGLKQLREPDIWWQLLTGRWMLESGNVTRTDTFSYTMEGTSWVNVKWLYEVVIATLEKLGGPHMVLLLQVGVNVAIAYLLLKTMKLLYGQLSIKKSAFFSVIAVYLFFALSEYRMAGRPEMVSHFMTALYLYLFIKHKDLQWKNIFWLIPLQCLWANMHEGYPIGIVIISVFTLNSFIDYLYTKNKEALQRSIRISAIAAAAVVAILINPNGVQLWKQPFEIFRQLGANKYTIELFNYTDPRYWTLQAQVHIATLILAGVFWLGYIITARRKKQSLPHQTIAYAVLALLLGYLSLKANRNIPFAQIAIAPTLAIAFPWLLQTLNINQKGIYKTVAKRAAIIATLVGALLYTSVVSDAFYEYTESPNKYGAHVSLLKNPIGAANFIRRHQLKGPAFSDYFISSYLLWDLYPDFKSYIDLRDLDVFPASFFDDYFELNTNPNKFDSLIKKYDFNYIVLSNSQLKSLHKKLYWGHGYNLIYVDPVSIIFLKENDENDALNHDLSVQRLMSWPESYEDPVWATLLSKLLNPTFDYSQEEDPVQAPTYGAIYYNSVNNYRVARKVLLPALYRTDLIKDPLAYSTLGNTYIDYSNYAPDEAAQNARLDSARMYLEQAIYLDDKTASAYNGLANLALMKGDPGTAATYLNTYIKLKPKDDFGYYLRGISYHFLYKRNNNIEDAEQMIKDMKLSLKYNEFSKKANLYVAEGYYAKNDKDNCRKYLKAAVGSDEYWLETEKTLIDKLKTWTGIK